MNVKQELDAAKSIVAPIVLGVRLPSGVIDPVENALQLTAWTVPSCVSNDVRVVRDKRTQTKAREITAYNRRLLQGRRQDSSYFLRLCDFNQEVDSGNAGERLQWEVSVRRLNDNSSIPEAPSDATVLLLSVTYLRIFRGKRTVNGSRQDSLMILSARQLALTRHSLVEAFLAYDPDAIVVSTGQTDWQDDWWPERDVARSTVALSDSIAVAEAKEASVDGLAKVDERLALHCVDCGAMLRTGARFCGGCGMAVAPVDLIG